MPSILRLPNGDGLYGCVGKVSPKEAMMEIQNQQTVKPQHESATGIHIWLIHVEV